MDANDLDHTDMGGRDASLRRAIKLFECDSCGPPAADDWAAQPDKKQSADKNRGYYHMDKDRIEGAAKPAKGAVKEAFGKVVGDAKLHAEGKADEEGRWQQKAVGSLRDTHRKACAA